MQSDCVTTKCHIHIIVLRTVVIGIFRIELKVERDLLRTLQDHASDQEGVMHRKEEGEIATRPTTAKVRMKNYHRFLYSKALLTCARQKQLNEEIQSK